MISVPLKLSIVLRSRDTEQLRQMFLENEHLTPDIFHILNEKQWESLQKLYLGHNLYASLKLFRKCDFPSLQYLDFKNSGIHSIDGLSRASIPTLRELVLKNNKIVSVRELKSMSCPSLAKLVIYRNPLQQIFISLSACNFPDLQQLVLQYSNTKILACDIRGALKSNCEFNKFYVRNMSRINQEEVRSQLNNKYPSVNF